MMNVKEEILKIELQHTVNTLSALVELLEKEGYIEAAVLIKGSIKDAEEVLKV